MQKDNRGQTYYFTGAGTENEKYDATRIFLLQQEQIESQKAQNMDPQDDYEVPSDDYYIPYYQQLRF